MVWDESCTYAWAVICKNARFHHRQNQFVGHKILLGEADSFATRPAIPRRFPVRCDDCGKIYCYKLSDVLRFQTEIPLSFVPHLLFQQSSDSLQFRADAGSPQDHNESDGSWRLCPTSIFKSFLALLYLSFSRRVNHKPNVQAR